MFINIISSTYPGHAYGFIDSSFKTQSSVSETIRIIPFLFILSASNSSQWYCHHYSLSLLIFEHSGSLKKYWSNFTELGNCITVLIKSKVLEWFYEMILWTYNWSWGANISSNLYQSISSKSSFSPFQYLLKIFAAPLFTNKFRCYLFFNLSPFYPQWFEVI